MGGRETLITKTRCPISKSTSSRGKPHNRRTPCQCFLAERWLIRYSCRIRILQSCPLEITVGQTVDIYYALIYQVLRCWITVSLYLKMQTVGASCPLLSLERYINIIISGDIHSQTPSQFKLIKGIKQCPTKHCLESWIEWCCVLTLAITAARSPRLLQHLSAFRYSDYERHFGSLHIPDTGSGNIIPVIPNSNSDIFNAA